MLALTVVGALLPGVGLIVGGRRKLGTFVLAVSVALIGAGVYVGIARPTAVVALVVSPHKLLIVAVGLVLVGLGWVWVVVASHELVRPLTMKRVPRLAGALLVGVLSFAIALPTTAAVSAVLSQRDLIGAVFLPGVDSRSATRPTVNVRDPWANRPQLNVLLLGGDGGTDRTGIRTDSVMVASIDTHTGVTHLISLSRNWMRMPFPANSPLHKVYPDGFWDPSLGDVEQPEYYLDAMYENVPKAHPGILGPTDNEGADVLKESVGAAVGLPIDYYVQLSVQGFEKMIDALGGVTVNINYPVPIGGDYGLGPGTRGPRKPTGYLQPGPNQKLDGYRAMWFARGRYGLDDPSRQARQRCTIQALVHSANPATLVARYQQIAAAGKQMLRTDIPQELLPALVSLAVKMKHGAITNVDLDAAKNFPTGRDPNYRAIRELVQQALHPVSHPVSHPATTRHTSKPAPTQSLAQLCAYHPS
ncbi:LCP family protein [Kribbella sp.]|uniref:LCP family protein n=1 Tax=Kribbella sp. TaxID=1871183 RepID=UPI002D35B416|nr:LCP family protein [Kribbella sp.]HZX04081.1 LCP family protein [Kribbella sp.]